LGMHPLIKRHIVFRWTAVRDNDQKYFQLAAETFLRDSGDSI
jgi:hypothetical protein